MSDPIYCQSLSMQLGIYTAKVASDQQSIRDLQQSIADTQAGLAIADPQFPAWTLLGVATRMLTLDPMSPLLGQYSLLLVMYATLPTWQAQLVFDQGTVAGIQQQITTAGC